MELHLPSMVLLALATAVGATVQAATGFGFAIVAAPVFLAVLNSAVAVPILLALHVVQCAFIVPRVWASVPWQAFTHLAFGAAVGCPLGLWLFGNLDVRQLKLAAGIVILAAAGLLIYRQASSARNDRIAHEGALQAEAPATAVTGAVAGALTALLVMPGPPLMVHFLRRPLAQEAARALSITFFAACYVSVLSAHVIAGNLSGAAWQTVAWLVAPVLIGTAAGLSGARWLSDRHFAIALHVLLLAAGVGAVLSALI